MGLIPGSGRSPGEGHGNSLQYSCLENALDRGVWWATVLGVAKSQPWLKHLSMHHAEQVHKLWFAKPFYGLWHLIGEVQHGDPLILTLRFQFSSVAQSCPTLCDPMNCSTPGLPVHHELPEFTQTHSHRVGDAIQPSHPLSSPFPPAPYVSQNQSLFQWVNSSHEGAKVLEFQLQHHSFQRTPKADLL